MTISLFSTNSKIHQARHRRTFYGISIRVPKILLDEPFLLIYKLLTNKNGYHKVFNSTNNSLTTYNKIVDKPELILLVYNFLILIGYFPFCSFSRNIAR